jgi:hypothetical protein
MLKEFRQVEMSIFNKYRKDGCGLHSFTDEVDKVSKFNG